MTSFHSRGETEIHKGSETPLMLFSGQTARLGLDPMLA